MRIVAEDDAASIDLAVQALRRGHLVAFPTDTVYGVAALAADKKASSALFSAKGRPPERAIPIFIPSIDVLGEVASGFGEAELRLARAGLPGPLTIVLRRAPAFRSAALVGDDTVGVRIPSHPWVLALLRTLGEPLAVTSANRSGGPNPTTARDVAEQIGSSLDLLVDGGTCDIGVPSTVVDLTSEPPRILRQGAMARAAVEAALGRPCS